MDKVVHFEIPCVKRDRAVNFYTNIFGWRTGDIPDMEYFMVWAAFDAMPQGAPRMKLPDTALRSIGFAPGRHRLPAFGCPSLRKKI
jgi:predicted enzyme related to lactoylglutathione lyase